MGKLFYGIVVCVMVALLSSSCRAVQRGKIAILNDKVGDIDSSTVNTVADILKKDGYRVKLLSAADMADETVFNAKKFSSLILTNSPQFPLTASQNVTRFLQNAGNLILMGGQPFSDCRAFYGGTWVKAGMTLYNGKWMPPQEAVHEAAAALAKNKFTLFDFEGPGFAGWLHKPSDIASRTTLQQVEGKVGKAILMDIKGFATGTWDLYEAPLSRKIPRIANFIGLWAKGDANTTLASLSVFEKDGTNWVAVLNLTRDWHYYTLNKNDFIFHDSRRPNRGVAGDYLKLSNITKFSAGLSAYAHPTPGDHRIWLGQIDAFEAEIPANLPRAADANIDYFNDYEPILLSGADRIAVEPHCGIIDANIEWKSSNPTYHVQGFTVADKCKFMPLLDVFDKNDKKIGYAGGMLANYAGQFANSCWVSFGASDPSFYKSPQFSKMLMQVLQALERKDAIEQARMENERFKAMDAKFGPFDYVLSAQAFNAKYQFTKDSLLLESARAIRDMGSNVLKCEITSRAFAQYHLPSDRSIKSMRDLLEKEPSYKSVLEMPFDYYLFWAYAFCGKDICWFDGLSEKEKKAQYEEFYDLTAYLLTKFNDSHKTFYLGHWEGDWMLLHGFDITKDPNDVPIQGMIDWLNIRQKAVDDAKRQVPHKNVEVYHYTEMVAALKSIKGGKTLTNNVLPKTNVDYVSYSSYDSFYRTRWDDDFVSTLKKSLDYIESKVPAKDIPGKRVLIGEYGFPQAYAQSPQEQDSIMRVWASAALEWGCPFVLYWQLYCNTGIAGQGGLRGFWLINDKNKKLPTYITHYDFLQNGRKFVYDFRSKHSRSPTPEEFRKTAVDWLKPD